MINKIIAEYLASSPRITIPEFGAFLRRKESNEIVFMEILKRDDGVLKSLIQNTLSVSPTEAAAIVENYVGEVEHALQADKKYIIDAVGVLFRTASGTIDFTCNPFAHSIPAPEQRISVLKLDDEKPESPKPAAATDSARPEPTIAPLSAKFEEPAKPATLSEPEKDDKEEEAEDDERENSGLNFIEKIRHQHAQPIEDNEEQERKIKIRTNRKRIKLDPITILAIIAAALAIGSLVWGAIPSRAELNLEPQTEENLSAEEGK